MATAAGLSWLELRDVVREARRTFATPAWGSPLRTPTGFAFRACRASGRVRLYFLSSLVPGKESTLLYVDLDEAQGPKDGPLVWQALIQSSFRLLPPPAQALSKEEQLMSERKRSVAWGLSHYELHAASGQLVFPAAGSLFGCRDPGPSLGSVSPPGAGLSLSPHEIKSGCLGTRLNPTLCPVQPDLVGFVGQGDLYVVHGPTSHEARLTHVHLGLPSLADDSVTVGLPSYVMQEEFNRFTGFWWRPYTQDDTYWLLYEEVDEQDVDLLRFPQPNSPEVEEFRFPRPGTNNAKSTLRIVQFTLSPTTSTISNVVHLALKMPLDHVFSYAEYIVRAGWTPDGKMVWVQLLNRRQQLLEVVAIPFESFEKTNLKPVYRPSRSIASEFANGRSVANEFFANGDAFAPASSTALSSANATLQCQVIYTRTSDTWVQVNDILVFLPSSTKNVLEFILCSDEVGFAHLYHVTALVQSQPANQAENSDHEGNLRPRVLSKVALTTGDWCVVDKKIWVDSSNALVYFHGLMDTPLEKHLYVVSLNQPGNVRRLTTAQFTHNVTMADDCSMFVTVFSSIHSVPASQVFRITHSDASVDGVHLAPVGWIMEPKSLDREYQCPELFSRTIGSGDLLYGMIFKPHNMVPDKRYPVIVNVYGGPEVQLVTNTFKGMRQMRNHMLASQGYCVVLIDSRGSVNRGSTFEGHLRKRMGQVELCDQVEVLKWLLESNAYMDMHRVAIHGWSYGGYLALMGLIQYPKLFKVSVAGAPVTTWMNYDTGYTERYMDLPALNPDGYKLGSILNLAGDFPNEPNRLLIVHGLMDENVHFAHHTSQLIEQLVRCGKPYQLQVYPSERHSLRHLESSEHYETTLLAFLQNNL
eukprot:maker-scaffold842_size89644-snap-gene-0.13 protein:Tk06537 transcript:maker-scaffold842_size89644-snap-gene-0.13-mRNA-1 annotation:"dipeptidyl peptidase 9"